MQAKSIPTFTDEQQERFWSRVEVQQPAGCWEWRGTIGSRGYGQFTVNYKIYKPHRVAYALLIGDVPADMALDHLCFNKSCVNPDHIRVTTIPENSVRHHGPSGRNARKTHCGNGHEFTPENTYYFPNGDRSCRTCRVAWKLIQNERDKDRRRLNKRAVNARKEQVA